jgi:hypothetical protein
MRFVLEVADDRLDGTAATHPYAVFAFLIRVAFAWPRLMSSSFHARCWKTLNSNSTIYGEHVTRGAGRLSGLPRLGREQDCGPP